MNVALRPRQPHHKLRKFPFFRLNFNLPAMLLHDDVVGCARRLIDKPRPVPYPVGFVVRIENFLANVNKYPLAFVILGN